MSSPNRVGKGKKGTFVQRLTAGLLVFLFLITPIVNVFAEELNAETTVEQSEQTEAPGQEIVPLENPISIQDEQAGDLNKEQNVQDETEEPEAISQIPEQKNDSKYSNKRINLGQTDPTSGALTYAYPLIVPGGRNGLQPDLSLTYNSQSLSRDGLFGAGWSLNIPSIERINKRGTNTLYTEGYFNSSLSGELVNSEGAEWRSKIDNGEFYNYLFDGVSWTMTDKKGTKYYFGTDVNSRQDNPDNLQEVYKWMITEIRDTNDNVIRFTYFKDEQEIYPFKIFYTGHGENNGIFEIEFIRALRTDSIIRYYSGFPITTRYRISSIVARISAVISGKYDIEYVSGDNDTRSMLRSISETGYSETGQSTSFPPTIFEYNKTAGNSFQTRDLEWNSPVDLREGVMIMDVNGDALSDLVQSYHKFWGPDLKSVYLNNGNKGWVASLQFIPPMIFSSEYPSSPSDKGVREVDFNGDGRADLLQSVDYGGGVTERKAYLNTGSAWQDVSTTWNTMAVFADYNNRDTEARIFDLNGDGLSDIVQTSPTYGQKVYLNNGNGWSDATAQWNIPERLYAGVIIGDVNGDGLTDLMRGWDDAHYPVRLTYLNKGNGTWEISNELQPPLTFVNSSTDYGVRGADVNGDGLMDLLQRRENPEVISHAWINKGDHWEEDERWNPSLPLAYINTSLDTGTRLADLDGDGMVDIFRSIPLGEVLTTWAYPNQQDALDLVTEISLSQGGSTSIEYASSANLKDEFGNALNPGLPIPLRVVTQIMISDGSGNLNVNNFSYANGKYYYGGYLERKFSGFGKVISSDDDGHSVATSYHGGTQNEPQFGQYEDHISKMGKPYRIEERDSNGNLYSKSINKWERVDLEDGRNFVKQTRTVDYSYDGNSTHKDTAELYEYDNATGNQTRIERRGEVFANDDGSLIDNMENDVLITDIAYTNNTSNGVVGLPVTKLTTDINATKVNETRHYYDNLVLGQVGAGNETKTEMWRVGSKYIDTEKTYNSYGLVSSEKDPRDKTTSYMYDSYNLFPATVTNPLSQISSYSYDYSSGNVKQMVDVNGRSFNTVYDGLDRAIEEKQPDRINPNVSVTTATYEYTDIANAFRIKKSVYLNATNEVDSYTYFDGLGRKIQERTETENPNQYAVRDFVYKEGELLLKESLPYFSSGTAQTPKTAISTLYTNYNYDALKRVNSVVTAVGTTTNNYDDWKTTITDASGKVKDIYRDAYDNLVAVGEHNGSATYITRYNWNGQKKLTKITDALGNIRNFSYDGLGRVLSAEDLHAEADTSFGVWNYAYDDASNVASRSDANNSVVHYSYDDLNRVITEDSIDTKGIDVIYEYDTCAEGVGRLCVISNSTLVDSKIYNALGQVVQETKRVGHTNYTSLYDYDRAGNQVLVTNPDGSDVQYMYNAAGTINQIQRKESSDPSFINVITNIDYNEVGLPTVIHYANGSTTTNTYDAGELYRLVHKVTVANNQNVQDLSYDYDAVGNILQIVDASATQTAKTTDYTYDDLHRLLSSTITNSVAENVDGPENVNQIQTFTYDAIGNILSKSDVGTYSYDGHIGDSYANPHAVTSAGDTNYEYDNNGNMISAGSPMGLVPVSYAWDYNNRLQSITNGESIFTYSYDADGQRAISNDSAGRTLSITKEYSVTPNNTEKHIFLGDTAIATISGSNETAAPLTIHADHLTGSNVITDSGQAVDELTDYYAFGTMRIDEQNGTHEEKRKFTGHEYDVDTGLTYANARYYDAALGRWLSQDPVFLSAMNPGEVEEATQMSHDNYLGNPQTMNAYTYVANNPLKYKDYKGEFLDTVVDIGFIAYDLYKIGQALNNGQSIKGELGNLGLDLAGAALPGVTGLGMIARTAKAADKAADAVRVVKEADKAVDVARTVNEVGRFPSNPKDLLSNLPRDAKGRIQVNDTTRIRVEKHAVEPGKLNSPRHVDQHYHVDVRRDVNTGWNNKSTRTLTPPGWTSGPKGFLPGEKIPGFNKLKNPYRK